MANVISMKQLLEAGVHFGHQTRRWNPKMAEYIFTERNGIYIIDLQKTVKKVEEAYYFVRDIAASGEDILFVGTKKQAQDSIKEEAETGWKIQELQPQDCRQRVLQYFGDRKQFRKIHKICDKGSGKNDF